MASAAEQLAANLNLGVLSKATDLKKRIWFTLGALIVYRVGTYIPVPGVDASVMGEMLAQHGGGILGMFDMFTGGALGRMTARIALGIALPGARRQLDHAAEQSLWGTLAEEEGAVGAGQEEGGGMSLGANGASRLPGIPLGRAFACGLAPG